MYPFAGTAMKDLEAVLGDFIRDSEAPDNRGHKNTGLSMRPRTAKLLDVLTKRIGRRYRSETVELALIALGAEHGITPEDLE
jgi:hypothetical protein